MTSPIAVDPSALAATGTTIGGEGDAVAAAVGSLESGLSGAGAMFGHDAAGLVFAQSYTTSGKALLDAAAAAVDACRRVGFGVQTSAANYGHANAASTVGGGAPPVAAPSSPAPFSAPGMPPPFGGGIAAPLGWSLVEAFVGDVWPDGNPGQLRAAAAAWRTFGAAMSGLSGQISAAGPGLSAQQIPESGHMVAALGQISVGVTDIAAQAQTLASAVDGFAATVEATQDAVRGLLHQLSPAGILDAIGGIFTRDDPTEKIREVANEIKTVLNNMKREADASSQIFSQGVNLLDSATNSLENWANKEFTQVFGQAVGGALSSDFNALVDLPEGGIKFVAGTAEGLQQLDPSRFISDPEGAAKSWEGLLETTATLTNPALLASKVATDPQGSLDTLKGMVDWKDVEEGHPFRALGYNGAQVASAIVPGVGEAEPAVTAAGIEGRTAAATAGAEERAAAGAVRDGAPVAGRITSATDGISTQATRIGTDLDKVNVPESAPSAAPGPSAPTERAPVDGPPADAPGGRAPVDTAPPVEAPRPETPAPHVPEPGPAPEPRVTESHSPASESAPSGTPHSPDPPPAHTDPPPPPSHISEPAQIAESDPARPPGGGGPYESMPAASEVSTAMADSPQSGSGSHGADMSSASGADDKVPVGVGTHGAESTEGSAGGAGHGPGGGAGHRSGGDVSGHGSGGDGSGRLAGHGDDGRSGSDGDPSGHDGTGDHSHGDALGERRDPVHSREDSGDGWHRIEDQPIDPHYGEPQSDYWRFEENPADPGKISPEVQHLITDPEAPFGRAGDGHPYSQQEYETRFNQVGPDGQQWQRFPGNAGAAPGSKVAFDNFNAFADHYGTWVDRVGDENGSYLAVVENGAPAPWENRSLHVNSLSDPYNAYNILKLPEGWTIEVSEVQPGLGQPGRSIQVRIIGSGGRPTPIETLIEGGILGER